ncbi:MAG: ATP-binding protein [archaeon]
MKEIIKKIIMEFHERGLPLVISRDYILPKTDEITVIYGARRTGKTYILYEEIQKLVNAGKKKECIFINFEDERLVKLKAEDLNLIFDAYYELYPNNKDSTLYLFFDEIQEAPSWSYFIKRLYEAKKYRIFITGSSAKLLSNEIATQLRGRALANKVLPLSFLEFLRFNKITPSENIEFSSQAYLIKQKLSEYIELGGFPKIALINTEKEELLKNYLDLIIYKDLIDRFNIRNRLLLKYLINYAIINSAKIISLNNFFNSLKTEMSVSKDSVFEYFSYLEDISFIFQVPKFSYSLKEQLNSRKKVFLIDSGFRKISVASNPNDFGKALENAIFLELLRQKKNVFYYSSKNECDFLIVEKNKVTECIQVCYSLNEENKKREVNGLIEAMEAFSVTKGLIITFDHDEKIEVKGRSIYIVSAWKWMIGIDNK